MVYDTDVYFYDGTTYVRPDGLNVFAPPRYTPKEVTVPKGWGDGNFRYWLGRNDRECTGTAQFFVNDVGNDDAAKDDVLQLLDWMYDTGLRRPTLLTFNCDFFQMTDAILYVEGISEDVGGKAYSYVVKFRLVEYNNP